MDDDLTLRAFREEDLGFLDRLDTDPAALGAFEWFGFGDVRSRRRPAARAPRPGLGTLAQRRLVDHLFRFTTVHRLEAGTDAENHAEQKALERIGFTREGVLREGAFRDGAWRDSVIYALLRDDW